ncbi:MAG: DNA polymerase III subunit gamma/tau [Hespellia sp.]|nr:DNA polymerase III subunit gamma/tau [Hespellia sp.]
MLYTTYRPQTFSEVVGQEQNLLTIREQIKNNKFDSAYLFAGHRGTGKTTIARILARTICCPDHTEDGPCNTCKSCRSIIENTSLDCIELDAASHNSINDIKELINSTKYLPTLLSKKIYIIDEVHNLSASAFDALLKTIEEPPVHCIFILCTTELHKIPATIRSRCSIYQFSALSSKTICGRLEFVLKELDKSYEEDALQLIAKQSDGSMRDALSIAEKLIISCDKLTVNHVKETLCLLEDEIAQSIIWDILSQNGKSALSMLQTVYEEGKNMSQLTDNLLQCLTDGITYLTANDSSVLINTKDYQQEIIKIFENQKMEHLFWYIDQLCTLREKIRNSINPFIDVQLCIVKCCHPKLLNDGMIPVLARITKLEQELESLKTKGYEGKEQLNEEINIRADSPSRKTDTAEEESNSNLPESVTAASPQELDSPETENPFEEKTEKEHLMEEKENDTKDDDILNLFSDYL